MATAFVEAASVESAVEASLGACDDCVLAISGGLDSMVLLTAASKLPASVRKKLIVATSEPTTVEGRRKPEDDKTPQAFCYLDLTRPFAYPGGPKDTHAKIRKHEEMLGLVDFECRLDISGDVHHYARYWGDEHVDNYASVVAGGGGASMSTTQTARIGGRLLPER